ncbi:MAG: hypothetical protein EA360_07770 [Balneolaceae bacterium]|nr:MAG: hypothetical protein EA360_07770 [Balneolaceae bacterium]
MIQRILFKIFFSLSLPFLLLMIPQGLSAQSSMGARSVSMGLTGVALPGTPWSAFSNSALLPAHNRNVSFYGFRYVGIAEITDMAALFTLPVFHGTLAGAVHKYGFNLYQESRFLTAYKFASGRFHTGISLSYYHVNIGGNYGSAGTLGVDLGFATELTDRLWFGSRLTNLNQPSYGSSDEMLPREVAAGLGYYFSETLFMTAELVKDVLFPLSFRTGLELELVPSFFLRAGFTTEPDTFSAGIGFTQERWLINIGMQQHNPLGLSPALDMGILF